MTTKVFPTGFSTIGTLSLSVQLLGDDGVANGLLSISDILKQGPYTIAFFMPDSPAASQVAAVNRVPRAMTFPVDFGATGSGGSSQGGSLANAASDYVLTVSKCLSASDPTNPANFSTIGTITIASGTHLAVFATAGGAAQSLAAGDWLKVTGQSTPDGSIANVAGTLVADSN